MGYVYLLLGFITLLLDILFGIWWSSLLYIAVRYDKLWVLGWCVIIFVFALANIGVASGLKKMEDGK